MATRSGVITVEPPKVGTASYGILVPQVDADGNDIGGLRSLHLQAPIGTYTGWNLGRKDRFEDGFCSLTGSFVPFARTKQERLDAKRPAPLHRRALSDQGRLRHRRQESRRRPRGAALSAAPTTPTSSIKQAEGEGIRLSP